MFVVNSAISSVVEKRPNVFVICHNDEDYLRLLGDVKANFFIPSIEGLGWSTSPEDLPPNFYTVESLDVPFLSYCTCILVLNNHRSFGAGLSISQKCKAPMVHVKLLSGDLSYTRPFGTSLRHHPLADKHEHFRVPVWTSGQYNSHTPGTQVDGLMLYLRDDIPIETTQEFSSFTINNRIPGPIISRFLHSLPVDTTPLYRERSKVIPTHNFFIETLNGFSMSLLESMHAECVVFAPSNYENETLIQDGISGFLYKDFQELHEKIDFCKEADVDAMLAISTAASKAVSQKLTTAEKFTENWNKFFLGLHKNLPRS